MLTTKEQRKEVFLCNYVHNKNTNFPLMIEMGSFQVKLMSYQSGARPMSTRVFITVNKGFQMGYFKKFPFKVDLN